MQKYKTVTEYLNDLQGDKEKQVQLLRQIITAIHPEIEEHIKWNAPSYSIQGNDRITFGMNKTGDTTLVLHMGATRKETLKAPPTLRDDHDLVQWKSDIRGVMTFTDSADIIAKKDDITDILKRWVKLI